DGKAAELQIADELGLVDRPEDIDRLEIYDDEPIYEEVQPITAVELEPPEGQGQWHLSSEGDSSMSKLETEARLIRGLEEAGPQSGMHLKAAPRMAEVSFS